MATERLSLRIDAGLKKDVEREARREERSASYLAVKAIEAMLRGRTEKREAIRAAVAEADKGAFISQDAMDTWISSWDTEAELPPPEPDVFPGQSDEEACLPTVHSPVHGGQHASASPHPRTSRPQPPQDQQHVSYRMNRTTPVTEPDSSIFCQLWY